MILRMRSVPAMDITALNSLKKLEAVCKERHITLILSHVNEQPLAVMRKSGFVDQIGEENICANIDEALKRSMTL